jgi:hypothetical protein
LGRLGIGQIAERGGLVDELATDVEKKELGYSLLGFSLLLNVAWKLELECSNLRTQCLVRERSKPG